MQFLGFWGLFLRNDTASKRWETAPRTVPERALCTLQEQLSADSVHNAISILPPAWDRIGLTVYVFGRSPY